MEPLEWSMFLHLLLVSTASLVKAKMVPSGCGGGYFEDETIHNGFGNVKPKFDRVGKPTLSFEKEIKLQLTDGSNLEYPNNAVPRMVDYNKDGRMDLLIANKGHVYLHLQEASGKFKAGEALKARYGTINTGDTGRRYTGFAYGDLNGDGLDDIILTKNHNSDVVYYPRVQNQVTSDCKTTSLGKEYIGKTSQTRGGKTCQRWDSQRPHSHTRNDPSKFPDSSLEEAGNYCRNPDDETGGPWCYTTDPDTRWQFCDVPMCGAEYGEGIDLGIYTSHMRIDLADWDQDGDLDIIYGSADMYIFRNNGTKTEPSFTQKKLELENIGYRSYSRYPRVMDINNDGKLDMLISVNWGDLALCVQKDKGHFQNIYLRIAMGGEVYLRKPNSEYGEHQATDFNDLDGDGIMDIVSSGDSGKVYFLKGVNTLKTITPQLDALMAANPQNLGTNMAANKTLHTALWYGHKNLQDSVNSVLTSQAIKDAIYNWYIGLVTKYPQYLQRQKWTQPKLKQLAGYVWMVMWESRPETLEAKRDIINVTNQMGIYGKLFEDRNVFFIDNNEQTSPKAEWMYKFLMLKDPKFYSLTLITYETSLSPGAPVKTYKFHGMRDKMVNAWGWETYAWSQFPNDCQVCKEVNRSPKITNYMVILAHEVAHFEADAKTSDAWSLDIFRRKYRLIYKSVADHVVWRTNPENGINWSATKELWKSKGWWNGTTSWKETSDAHFSTGPGKDTIYNMIRPIKPWYFVKNPQETFATLANQYFSDSKLMLDFAMERASKGYQLNMDWFILIADYYSLKGNTFPMYRIGKMHLDPTILKYDAKVERNQGGFINKIIMPASPSLPGPTTYTCQLDEEGLTTSCTAS